MRLIDADALAKKWQDVLDEKADEKETVAYITFELFIDRLKEEPTIDAEPVKHGRWVSLTECANAGVYCSVCNKKVYKEDYAWCNRKNKLRSPYCPNCGAKMEVDKCSESES